MLRNAQRRRMLPACTWMLAAALVACGGDGGNGPGGASPSEPTRTPQGTPTGEIVRTTIGAAGGALATADGAVTLVVPAGALAGDTEIGIQPVTPQSPGAVGQGYRLTPEGQEFAQPVSVTFTYAQDDLTGTAPELLWIAYQTPTGAWRLADDVTVDVAAGALTVRTTHFSDWTKLYGLQIRPPQSQLEPGESIDLQVKRCVTYARADDDRAPFAYAIDCDDGGAPPAGDAPDPDLPPLPNFFVDASSWAVNGVRGGSTTYGFAAGQGGVAEFLAPAQVPQQGNPVAVSVRIRDNLDRTTATLVTNITIAGARAIFHLVGEFAGTVPIAAFGVIEADVTDRFEADVLVDGAPVNSGRVESVLNSPSGVENARFAPPGNQGEFCGFTLAGPYEHFGASAAQVKVTVAPEAVRVDLTGTTSYPAAEVQGKTDDGCVTLPYVGQESPIGASVRFDPRTMPNVGDRVTLPPVLGEEGWTWTLERRQ